MSELPNGWVRVPLDELFFPRSIRISPTEMPDALYIGLEHVEAQTNRLIATVSAATMTSSSARFFAGDVLYGRMRPYLNKVVSPKFDGLSSAEFIVFPSTNGIESQFVLKRFSATDFVQFACSQYEGDRPRVKFDQLGKFQIDLPPAAEQTRIVAKLEELLSDLDAGVAELKAAQKKLAQYRQSLLKAAVEDSGYGNTAYSKHPLGTLVTAIGQGWSPKCDREPAQEDDQWAVMKTTAIQPLEFDGAHNKALPVELKPREHLELKPGDLLVTRAGPRNRVGITCLVKKTRSKLILCDKAYRIQCDQTRISPDFLELVLNAPHMLQKIDELKTGISDSGLNLTQDRFFSLEIPLPSLQKQLSIVEAVSTQFKLIQAQEKAIERSLQQSTAQRNNILQAAFSGQLVPQDPTDEPASVLLQRIRAERAAQASAPKVRKARAVKGVA